MIIMGTRRRNTVITPHLKFLRIVHSRNGLHQVGSRVVAKVGADITDAQASTAGLQILWMLILRLVQRIDLQNRQKCQNTNCPI